LRSYRKQADEISAARLSISTVSDERDRLRSQLSLIGQSYADVQCEAGHLSGANAQLLVDLRSFEQQNVILSRRLQDADGKVRAATSDCRSAEEQLASMRLLLGGLERSREVVQRDSAASQRDAAAMRAQFEQLVKDREVLQQQLGLSRAHVQQLEALSSELRRKSHTAKAAAEPGDEDDGGNYGSGDANVDMHLPGAQVS